ncbi:RTA1 like protein-domain-containing protein [Dendryphion nanum]|uniref:RTA1 like protein-domain-containing protein n=1 Tax=Dendryphion nanum TaxID=256645 RepID=A0A9P9DPC9_9PLEO|nr:RTA1 like protein-domain-containing protein [Dendryphion nanum]
MATRYEPAGNIIMLSFYIIVLIPQIYLGIRHKTWGFSFGMVSGIVLEILGYISRIQMAYGGGRFIQYLVCLTIGPAFFSAALYLCLARVIAVFGEDLSILKPRTYAITFMIADFIALVLQASGGAVAGGKDISKLDMGIKIVQAGLAAHLTAMVAFITLAAQFTWSAYTRRSRWGTRLMELQSAKIFKYFLIAMAIASVCIFIRTCYRVAELSGGFESDLAENETAFLILEGAVLAIGVLALTIFHPGLAFKGRWAEANFELRKTKKGQQGSPVDSA